MKEMVNPTRVRNTAWYDYFKTIHRELRQCNSEWDYLNLIYTVLDRHQAFKYNHIAISARNSLDQLISDIQGGENING